MYYHCGSVQSAHRAVLPNELQDQPCECYIAPTASGPFQTSYSSARVEKLYRMANNLKFVITLKPPPAAVSSGVQEPCDALHLMMSVQLAKHVSSKVTEHYNKDWTKNKLVESLEQKQFGWSPDSVQTTGREFLDLMTDVLCYTDWHAKTLESQSLVIPSLFF